MKIEKMVRLQLLIFLVKKTTHWQKLKKISNDIEKYISNSNTLKR